MQWPVEAMVDPPIATAPVVDTQTVEEAPAAAASPPVVEINSAVSPGAASPSKRESASSCASRRMTFVEITVTRAPLGIKIDHNAEIHDVLPSAEDDALRKLRVGDALVGVNDTLFCDANEEVVVEPHEIVDLVSEYLDERAFPLRLVFRRDLLVCRPKTPFDRATLVGGRRASDCSLPLRRRRTTLACRPRAKRRRTTASGDLLCRPRRATPTEPSPEERPDAAATGRATDVTGITGAEAQEIPALEGLAAAETTAPGSDRVAVLARIMETHAPSGSVAPLRKYAPASQALKAGSSRLGFLEACPATLTRAALEATYARCKKEAPSLLPLGKFLFASRFQCFLCDAPAARADYARLKASLED